MSEENGIPKDFKHLGKFYLKVSVVASRSYATQRQNPFKSMNFSFYMKEETWKSQFQETLTSGTYRYPIQNSY